MQLRLLPLVAALALGGGVLAASQDPKPPGKEAAKPAAAAAKKEYVNSETCAGCHDEINTNFKKNPHASLETNNKRGWAGKACEACHGPGSVHAESTSPDDIRTVKQMNAAQIDALCLNCHKNQATHVGRLTSSHARSAVACTACHNMHKTGAESSFNQFRKASGINAKCTECHTNVWAAFQRPHHHKVPEGAMSCTACHNPHEAFQNRNLRLTRGGEPGCLNCHADKRGPFVFDHAPVESEPCSTCHEPHGSANPRMLTRANVGLVCMECHANVQSPAKNGTLGGVPPAIHDLRSARYRNCTICHQKVHGSQVNKAFLR